MKTELRPTPETEAAMLMLDCDDSCVEIYTRNQDGSLYMGNVCRSDKMAEMERERDEARDLAARLERENENLRNALHLAESTYRDAIASSDKFESLYNNLRWLPLSRLTPTKDDGNDVGDVEFSDGSDIWEAAYSNSKNATHWRSVSLPNND